MAKCSICTKNTAVSLYIRVKPLWTAESGKIQAAKKEYHKFFGYWPPDSHLANYFRLEMSRGQSILQPLFVNNCRGHSFTEIVEAIENIIPPISGVPIKILWNPSPKVTEYLRAESLKERQALSVEINNDLRYTTVYEKSNIQTALKNLFNNTVPEITHTIFYPNIGSRMKAHLNGRRN